MKIVAVANSAGGSGKTSTAHALAVAASEYGQKVLLIDATPEASLTFALGVENPRFTLKEVLSGEFSLEIALIQSKERFSFLPSSERLASIETLGPKPLAEILDTVVNFDLVIVDTESRFTILTQEFFKIADLVISPTSSEIFSIRGVLHVKDYLSSFESLALHRCIFIESNIREKEDLETEPNFQELLETIFTSVPLLEPTIEKSPLIPQAQLLGVSVLTTSKDSVVAAQYREIGYSILEELKLM